MDVIKIQFKKQVKGVDAGEVELTLISQLSLPRLPFPDRKQAHFCSYISISCSYICTLLIRFLKVVWVKLV